MCVFIGNIQLMMENISIKPCVAQVIFPSPLLYVLITMDVKGCIGIGLKSNRQTGNMAWLHKNKVMKKIIHH